jgi:universal stress protein A
MLQIARILVPVDFSPASKAALDVALSLAERFDSKVEALHVWELPVYVRPDLMVWKEGSEDHRKPMKDVAQAQASQQMDEFMLAVPAGSRGRITEHLVSGSPVDVILDLVERDNFDLVVMGTHGRTGLSHWLLGSVAERVARGATRPVLTVRAPKD